ncbi:MAG: dihydroorotate dehydrogenase electron transfer subunit [Treponema sp.]|jgi:NAD(P)H-flavin reductase|nr:dihydroorotate dehydrogenase electron transfer subunit [Treponema sp.]
MNTELCKNRRAAHNQLCVCTASSGEDGEGGESIVQLEFDWQGPPPEAGQFFMLRPERTSAFLGRPFSAAGWTRAGAGGLHLRFLVARRGKATAELCSLRPGERVELSGPLGRGWQQGARDAGLSLEGPLALVAGGLGIAPLAALASELDARRAGAGPVYDLYAGFRDKPFGIAGLKPRSLVTAVEAGSEGRRGFVTDFFSPAGRGAVLTCGPLPMMRIVAAACREAGIPCLVSMETRMACGVGACLGCTIRTRDGHARCCTEGPVFDARIAI